MAAGLSLFYKGPTHLVQKLVLSRANSCLLSFLIFARNQRGWINAILKTLDPAGALKLNAQLAENIESMLAWIYSAWINVSCIMITIDHPDPLNQQNNDKNKSRMVARPYQPQYRCFARFCQLRRTRNPESFD